MSVPLRKILLSPVMTWIYIILVIFFMILSIIQSDSKGVLVIDGITIGLFLATAIFHIVEGKYR